MHPLLDLFQLQESFSCRTRPFVSTSTASEAMLNQRVKKDHKRPPQLL